MNFGTHSVRRWRGGGALPRPRAAPVRHACAPARGRTSRTSLNRNQRRRRRRPPHGPHRACRRRACPDPLALPQRLGRGPRNLKTPGPPPRRSWGYALRELLSMAARWGPGWPAGRSRWAGFLPPPDVNLRRARPPAAAYGRGVRGHVLPHGRAAADTVVPLVDVPDRALTVAFQAAGAAMAALCLASPGPPLCACP